MVGNNDYRDLKGQIFAKFLSLTQDQQMHFFYMMEMEVCSNLIAIIILYYLCVYIVTVYRCHYHQVPLRVLDMVVVGVEEYFL